MLSQILDIGLQFYVLAALTLFCDHQVKVIDLEISCYTTGCTWLKFFKDEYLRNTWMG